MSHYKDNTPDPNLAPQADSDTDVLEDSGYSLLLYNDDVHTFDYVIKALVHCHGSCSVKRGSYSELLPMHTALLDKQLTSEIKQ